MSTKQVYDIGIKIESKEHYDHLMEKHSDTGIFGLDFKRLFNGYPEGYPCLVQYMVDVSPFNLMYSRQLTDLVNDGYKVLIEKE